MRLAATTHQRIYFIGLLLIVVGLLFSKPLMSMAQMLLIINWLWEGNLKAKWHRFRTNTGAVMISSIFLLHLIGLTYTADWAYALHDLKIKLPLLVLPLIISSSPPLSRERFTFVISVFITTVLIATFVSTFVFLGFTNLESRDIRDISIFISHIRFSLLICLAIFALLYFATQRHQRNEVRLVQVALAFWLFLFMIILQSMTGMVILAVTGYAILLYRAAHEKRRWVKLAAITGLVVAPLLVAGYIVRQVSAFYDIAPIDYAQLETHTEGGEKYNHHKGQSDIENGHYVWTYVAVNELEAAWEQRSHLQYAGKDLRGQHLRATLIRFLASKGLRKDAAGVAQLSQKEVKAIEQGVANVHRMQGVNLETRIDEIIGEFDRYLNGGNPQGNSVTQRLEFWKAGWGIVRDNPFIGIGTGDVKQAYQQQYEATNSLLDSKYRLRAHNQFLTILVAFGCIGLIWFLVALLYPVLRQGQRPHFFYWVFLFIALLSMLNEDTLETQVGVTFFAFFNCLFLFGWKRTEHLSMIPDHNASIGATIMRVMKAS